MYLYGKVIVIKRNGTDGAPFPLTAKCCVFGRGLDSDIRIQLPTVDTSQCQILVDDKDHVFIQSTSTTSLTLVNDKALTGALTALSHGDIITIVDRKFRFEFPVDSRFYPRKSSKPKSPRTPKRASMVFIQSTSTTSLTLVNDKALTGALTALSHGDIITIVDRKFRFEFPVDSRFYPRKSSKPKSPRTPKRASMTKLPTSGEKASSSPQHLIPVTPLSPRTDNVPASIKSPRSASKVLGQPVPGANVDQFSSPQTGRQLYGSAKKPSSPEMLFNLSPNAFYRTSITPGTSRDISDPQEGKGKAGLYVSSNTPLGGQVNQAFQKSPAAVRQKSPGSPISKTPGNLRKSISDLRRRSVPVFETEEDSVQVEKKNQLHDFATPSVQLGNKRKSTAFDLLSAKRKRVSFGPNLSPEHFDKTLPPKTPIKKGATPSRIIKQERKSLLKAKSPGRKSKSPQVKSPARGASTPTSSQVFEVSVNTETFSPTVTSVDGAKLQSPNYESVPPRSPRGRSENEALSLGLGSPGRKLSPANKRNSPASVKLSEKDASVIEFSDQEMPLSNAETNSASDLAVLSQNTKLYGKDVSPLFTGNSVTPRSFSVSPTEKKRSVGRPRSKSSISVENSPTSGRSDSSFQKSATPASFSVSPTEKKHSVGRPRSKSPPSLQSPATSSRSDSSFRTSVTPTSFSVSPTEKKRSVGRPRSKSSISVENSPTSGRSDSSFQKSATPTSFSVSPTEKKRSVGRPRSKSPPSLQSPATSSRSDSSFRTSVTPTSFSVSPTEKKRSVGRPRSKSSISVENSPTSGRSDSSFQKSATPTSFSVSTIEKKRSVGRPRSKSTPSLQSPATSSRSDSSFRKSVTPRKSHSPLEKSISVRASLSPKNILLDASDSAVLSSPVNRKYAKTPVTADTECIEIQNTSAKSRKSTTPLILSQDLFSQVSPNAVAEIVMLSQGHTSPKFKGTKLHNRVEVVSPVGLTRIFKTPKHRQTANISPSAIKGLMKTPKVKHIQISPISPIGLRNLVKTPRNRKGNQVVDTPTGLIRLLKTPHVMQVSEASLTSVKEMKKSPRSESADVSYSGVSTLFSTPDISAQALSVNSGRKSVSKSVIGNTPRRYSQTPKKFLETPVNVFSAEKKRSVGRPPSEKKQHTDRPSSVERPVSHSPSEKRPAGRPSLEKRHVGRPSSGKKQPLEKPSSVDRFIGEPHSVNSPVWRSSSEKSPVGLPPSEKRPVGRPPSKKSPMGRPPSEKRPVGRPPSGKKTPPGTKNSPTEKIISPPQDFKKVVALRAIHGHGMTPKRATFKVLTPTSSKASSLFRKTPGKKTWSDIVKSGVQKPAPAKKIELTAVKAVTKRISPTFNKVHKTPKTPRALARALAPTTGHADSPATIIVGRKFKGTLTPKLLPRKGRKESLSKASRKSMGNTSFTGLAEMFTEPVVSESSLYADIPDTPDGPNEMFVSPLSSRKPNLSTRKSTNLIGVKELFLKKRVQETNYIGVKELFTSSEATSTVSPSGLKRLMKTPKKRAIGVSPTGVKRLLATPKIKGVLASPSGLDNLFTTPTLSGDTVPFGESALNQAARSGKTEPLAVSTKSGQRGRKRKSEEPYATISSKKKLTPLHLTADLSPRSPRKDHQELPVENKVASARKASPGKSPTPSGKRQSEALKVQAAIENRGSPAVVSAVDTATVVNKSVGQSDKQTLSPKSVRGRQGKAAAKTSTLVGEIHIQSPPQVGGHGRRGQVEISESAVNIERVILNDGDKHILPPPKGGRRGKAAVKETAAPVQSPPKVGARGRRGGAQIEESTVNVDMVKGAANEHILSPPKVGPRGRQRKTHTTETTSLSADAQSPPKVGARGRRGQAGIKEPRVNIKAVADDDKHILSPPKVGPRGRQRKAQIKETVSLTADVQSPPKVGARGRRGQAGIKESGVNIKTVDDEHILSSPKVGPRGRRGQAGIKESGVNIEAVADDDKHILSPPKVGPRGRQRKAQIKETVSLAADDVQSPPKVGVRGRQRKAQIKESTDFTTEIILALNEVSTSSSARSGHRQGGKQSKETLQAEENATLVEPAKPLSKGKRGRGQTKEAVHVQSVSSLNVDGETAGSEVLQSRAVVIESVSGNDASVAVIENALSPVATRGGRGRSKTKSASAEGAPTLDVKAVSSSKAASRSRHVEVSLFQYNEKENLPSTKTTANRKKGEAKIVNTLDNTSAIAQSGGKRGKKGTPEVVPQETKIAATNNPKGRGGRRRNETLPVTESALSEKSSSRRAGTSVAPVTSVSSSAGTPEGKQIGGLKRKAGTSTAVSAKKVKFDSPVPVSPVKPRASRKGQHAEAKSPSINTFASPKGRGRPKKGAAITEVASPLINAASVIPAATPKGGKGQVKAAAVSSPGGRGRPKKAAGIVSVIPESSPKGRRGQLKRAETVQLVASPSAGKQGRPKKDVSAQDGTTLIPNSSPAKGRQGKLKKAAAVETIVSPASKKQGGPKASPVVPNKSNRTIKSAGAISAAAAVLPKSTVATRRRRL